MSDSVNTLPLRTYVRSRTSTIANNVAGQSSGSVALNLDQPSDVTLIVVSDSLEGVPTFLTAAVDRAATMLDFDIITSPTTTDEVKPPHFVTLHLQAGQSTLNWATFGPDGGSQAFGGGSISRLVVAIDQ